MCPLSNGCPYCGKKGLKRLKGYCCKAHRRLHRRPQVKNIPCAGCGIPQRRNPSAVSKSGKVYCKRCKRAKGENHYKWRDGAYIDKAGYRLVLVNESYRREHRVVWEQANLAFLLERGSIHHIRVDLPFNKTYNDPDNLVLVTDQEHGSFHRLYDAEKYEKAFEILHVAARRQLHYPRELDNLIEIRATDEGE